MSTASFDYSPPPAELSEDAAQILVCRYEPGESGTIPYMLLPNVACDGIQLKEGAEPPTARFRYILNSDSIYPSAFQDLWPIAAPPNPYRIQCGDRLVCLYYDPEGAYRVLWDGFAQLPQVDVAGRTQDVTFVGVGVAVRLWDNVVTGRWQRDGSDPEEPGDPVQTDLPTRFNPDDEPNCTPDDFDEEDEESGESWPVFLEPKLKQVDGKTLQTYWDLSKFARYMLWYYNDQEYVDNPDFGVLDSLLSCRAPRDGQSFFDPDDPSTYDEKPIVIRDLDATNRPPMEAIEQQLEYAGFRMRFVTEGTPIETDDESGIEVEEPWNYIEVYRFDAGTAATPKTLRLAPEGAAISPATSNVESFRAVSDFQAVANRWTVESGPVLYEVGVLLAPGFEPAAGDETPASRKQWLRSNQDSATEGDREKYRLWIADECGEGHWDLTAKEWVAGQSLLLAEVFLDEETNPGGEYARRYRPGRNTLFSPDPSGTPYRAMLKVSRDYDGLAPPGIWDGTGTWQTIDGGWRLLHDRLGIYIDVENPMEWDIGKPDSDPAQEPSGVLDAVTSIANPGTAQRQKPFWLMLVTVIEGDRMIGATADTRPACPYPFSVSRQVDAEDHFVKQLIDYSSPLSPNRRGLLGEEQVTWKDDTPFATAYAEQMRAAREFPPIAATATIPWFTRAYSVGDRIAAIDGRGVSLQSNAGKEQSEAPAYPYVVAIDWDFSGRQSTILQLSDRRSEPAPYRR